MSKNMNRKKVEKLLGNRGSYHECCGANKHAYYPDPMEPVQSAKLSQSWSKIEYLAVCLATLENDYFQHHAYGTKNLQNSEWYLDIVRYIFYNS